MIVWTLLLNFIYFTGVCAQGYVHSECLQSITSINAESNMVTLIDKNSLYTETYSITNAPQNYITQTPEFLAATVDPTTEIIYAIVTFGTNATYLASLETNNAVVTIISPNKPLKITFASITFNCNGILYGIEVDSLQIFTINLLSTHTKYFDNGYINKTICIDCREVIAYNYDLHMLIRVSSYESDSTLYIYPHGNQLEIEYSIHDPNEFCSYFIYAIEYIGHNNYLISCGGAKQRIYGLSTKNIKAPKIVDVGTINSAPAVGIIALGADGSVCIPEPGCIKPEKTSKTESTTIHWHGIIIGIVIGLFICTGLGASFVFWINFQSNKNHKPKQMTKEQKDKLFSGKMDIKKNYMSRQSEEIANKSRTSDKYIPAQKTKVENEDEIFKVTTKWNVDEFDLKS